MRRISPDTKPLVVVLVGLPARGKTYIGRKIARYLSWLGYSTRVFNIGEYRRERLGTHLRQDWFDATHAEGSAARSEMAQAALADLLAFLKGGGDVGIYDATNATRARRDEVAERCTSKGCQVVFVESICEDPTLIEANIRETKLRSPDYAGVDPEEAARDFRARIDHCARVYEPIQDDPLSYIKLIDFGRLMVVHRIHGHVPGKIVSFLMNLHLVRRPVWLTRHGESEFNREGRIGGDPDLTADGDKYARVLAYFVREKSVTPPVIWCSTLRRAVQTTRHMPLRALQWRALDEIDAGTCDGMTYDQIEAQLPKEYADRAADKLNYRYPRGESYADVIQRLEPVIIETERQTSPVLIVAHLAVLRALYAYFTDQKPEECLTMEVPFNTVIELKPGPYGFDERRHVLDLNG
jgi:broad specificity phosphatase PhoE